MEFVLQRELPHQQRAVDAVCNALRGIQIVEPSQFFENPAIRLNDPVIKQNIDAVQYISRNGVQPEYRGFRSEERRVGKECM